MAINIEQARHNMLENQLRPWDVLDKRVLGVLSQVHREDFVPEAYRHLAFADLCLPLGHGEVMMKPVMEGRILQALNLTPTDCVLEVGTGSGFFTACLAHLAESVTSLDIHSDFTTAAATRLRTVSISNVELLTAEAICQWQASDQFDVVVLTGAVFQIPGRMLSWLNPGGRLLAIRGDSPAKDVVRFSWEKQDRYREESLFETDLPYLIHAEAPQTFTF